MAKYDHHAIEQKWQERWSDQRAFEAKDFSPPPAEGEREGVGREKCYLLIEFPYPSGDGLHVGHLRPYVGMDVIARKRRMEGKNVLYPVGWDAFGLPTENYALKTGVHPRVATEQNIANLKRQIQMLGISFDWSREVNTTDPAYYKWTQWIFLKLLEHGLAYKARIPINWCTRCKIGLANEEVVGGVCERCGGPVEKRDREQWMLKITAYAEKLLAGLEHVDYIERAKVQQINWIGKSAGALLKFQIPSTKSKTSSKSQVQNLNPEIEVFTTRPDTLFGATYLVFAPEHPLVTDLLSPASSRAERSEVEGSRSTDRDFSAPLAATRSGRNDAGMVLENPDEVRAYLAQARKRTDIERTAEDKGKTGVELKGVKAVNPANGEGIPIWIADYVLAHYGTGAIMAVPAHDERDFAFAQQYGLPIREVIHNPSQPSTRTSSVLGRPPLVSRGGEIEGGAKSTSPLDARGVGGVTAAYTGDGILVNSGPFSGMASEDAKRAITEAVGGKLTVTYKLRDWVFSRQRYWGEPIPVVFCANCTKGQPGSGELRVESGELSDSETINYQLSTINSVPHAIVPVPESQLPVLLPEVEKYQPTDTGDSPLAAITEWVNTKCPRCGGSAKRETDVMPNWAGSSWYYLAYLMRGVDNQRQHSNILKNVGMSSALPFPIARYQEAFAYWMPVDWYNGGMEHTTLHLLYSRFWYQFLYDIAAVPEQKRNLKSFFEPYLKRTSHGLILATDGEKMSKSRGNVVNPDEIVEKFGADAVRLYEMFIGPFDQPVPWSTDGLVGCRRFLEKVVTLAERVVPTPSRSPSQGKGEKKNSFPTSHREGGRGGVEELDHLLHKTIKKVTDDIEAMRFNTAVSAMMEFANALSKHEAIPLEIFEVFLRLLAPFAPHLCEELYSTTLNSQLSTLNSSWPPHDPALIVEDEIDLVVQVNGKVRATIRVPADIAEADARTRALAEVNVAKYVGEKQPVKVIFVPKRLINIVV